MKLRPQTLVVLEGIDASGKSTQLKRLARFFPDEHFTHQPSGDNVVGAFVYELTESKQHIHPLTRQLLHLAAHSEAYEREIIPALRRAGVFMDRCWWSTFAYGYAGGRLGYSLNMDGEQFLSLTKEPTQGVEPDLVLLFLNAWRKDEHNSEEVSEAYRFLEHSSLTGPCVRVPAATEEQTTRFIIQTLRQHGLIDLAADPLDKSPTFAEAMGEA